MFANWNTPFWTPEMANLSCQCKKIQITSWSFYRFYVVMEEKEEEENNGGDIEELNSWMPLLQFVCWPEYYFEGIYIFYSTCCYESKCRLCASHLSLRMSQTKYLQNLQNTKSPPSRRILGNSILFIISSVQISLFIEITFISSSNCSVLQ